jgi:hypothetical protein
LRFFVRHAEGWFIDPFAAHEQRWISDGSPTELVRDDGVEAYDSPPAGEVATPLVPAPPVVLPEDQAADTLKRADDAQRESKRHEGVDPAIITAMARVP